jgi:hypothetical protein
MVWILLLFAGCKETPVKSRSSYKPILMDRSQLPNSIIFLRTKPIVRAGQIRTNATLLLVVEQYEGVHIYDNTNASSPVEKGYLVIPGCMDIVLNNNVLYANNANDLVTIDLSDLQSGPVVVDRKTNVFPELNAPDGYPLEYFLQNGRPANTVVVDWVKINS